MRSSDCEFLLSVKTKRKRRKGDHYRYFHQSVASWRCLLLALGGAVGCLFGHGYFQYYIYLCRHHHGRNPQFYMWDGTRDSVDRTTTTTTTTTPTSLRTNVHQFLSRHHHNHLPHSLRSTTTTTAAAMIITPTWIVDVAQYWFVLHHYANVVMRQPNPNQPLSTTTSVTSTTTTGTTTTITTASHHINNDYDLERACTDPPGQGWEGGHGAYQLLHQKIQIVPPPLGRPPVRLLCAMYTYTPGRDRVRMAALTWGLQCDGFIAFTNCTSSSSIRSKSKSVPNHHHNDNTLLGIISIPQIGIESYDNMWQKTRAIWYYIYTHYRDDYDYIHLSGDDIYLLVPNLKHFLYMQQERPSDLSSSTASIQEVFAGQWVRQKNRPYVGGGPGYTISRSVLHQYIQFAYDDCYPNVTSSAEDHYFSLCLQKYTNISLTDTRDVDTGEQTYHDVAPQQVYDGRPSSQSRRKIPSFHSRAVSYYEQLPPPQRQPHNYHDRRLDLIAEPWRPVPFTYPTSTLPCNDTLAVVVGPKYGLNAAAKYSISFHKISSPLFMLRIHAILYPSICPTPPGE